MNGNTVGYTLDLEILLVLLEPAQHYELNSWSHRHATAIVHVQRAQNVLQVGRRFRRLPLIFRHLQRAQFAARNELHQRRRALLGSSVSTMHVLLVGINDHGRSPRFLP